MQREYVEGVLVLLAFRFIIITYNSNKVQSKECKKFKFSSNRSVKTANFMLLDRKTEEISFLVLKLSPLPIDNFSKMFIL